MAVLLAAFSPSPAGAGSVSPELTARREFLGPDGEIPVIVRFSDRVDVRTFLPLERSTRRRELIGALKGKAAAQQREVRRFLAGRGRSATDIWIINALAARLSGAEIDVVSMLPGVETLSPDLTITAPSPLAAAGALPAWNIERIGAPALWALGVTGAGVTVANLDTGVDLLHPDLQPRWRGGTNSWFNPYAVDCTPCLSSDRDVCPVRITCSSCDVNGSDPCDADGHGTQTMGIMAGGDAGGTAVGVAPDSRWIAAKIFADPVGTNAPEASTSVIHQAFQWVLDPDGNPATDDAPGVVNNSWGLAAAGTCLTEFETDVAALTAVGIAVVFAAGNAGPAPASSESPANYAGSISVGAVDDTDTIALSSSRGPSACTGGIFPIVTAPGVGIRTTDLTFGGVITDAYATVSGTSFAGPHVAGAMALLLSAFPGASVADLEAALADTAVDLGAGGPDNVYGYGLLDIAAAYRQLHPGSRVAVFRQGAWYLDADGSGSWDAASDTKIASFGVVADLPVTGDWNGDGKTEIGVYRNGVWYLDADGSGTWNAVSDTKVASFGIATDVPVTGDWNGDGRTEVGVFRSGAWYLDADGSGNWNAASDTRIASFGIATDIPVTGDWNGDGRSEIGVFRNGAWYLDADGSGTWNSAADTKVASFGIATDVPVTGDWNGDGRTEIGVFRNGRWYLDADGSETWTPASDLVMGPFGIAADKPVSGAW